MLQYVFMCQLTPITVTATELVSHSHCGLDNTNIWKMNKVERYNNASSYEIQIIRKTSKGQIRTTQNNISKA